MKLLYTLGCAYVAACMVSLLSGIMTQAAGTVPFNRTPKGSSWFQNMKPYCNSVEIATHMAQAPPPANRDGAAYAAACYALAGKIEEARAIIDELSPDDRVHAATIVFNIGHPVADAGDDRSAGPIMRLVVVYQPSNYMALYHAGMSEHAVGEFDLARTHLKRFLEIYTNDDGWRSNALVVLRQLEK